jgi:hypothetical protein
MTYALIKKDSSTEVVLKSGLSLLDCVNDLADACTLQGIDTSNYSFRASTENLVGTKDGVEYILRPEFEIPPRSKAEKKMSRDRAARAAFEAKSPLEKYKSYVMWNNDGAVGKHSAEMSGGATFVEAIRVAAENTGNSFVESVATTVLRYNNCSEKQAFVLAKFALDNGVAFV